VAGRVRESGFLVHKVCSIGGWVEFGARSSSFLLTVFFHWFILLSVRQLPDHLINAISVEEERGGGPI
jgi:hypothetical protein